MATIKLPGSTPAVRGMIAVGTLRPGGSDWFNVPYALVATPRTFVVTALTITTAPENAALVTPKPRKPAVKRVTSKPRSAKG